MSKVGIALGVLVLGSGASVMGAYALGAFDPDYELDIRKIETNNESEVRKDIKKEGCVKSLFGDLGDATNIGDDVTGTEPILTSSNDKPASGCLVVNWDRGNGSENNKGKGSFSFLWAMKAGEKGFIVFASAVTEATSKTKFKGVGYITKQNDTTKTGIIEKKKYVSTEQAADNSKFPQSNSKLDGMDKVGDYGGLTTTSDEFKNVETKDDSAKKGESTRFFRGYWEWHGNSGSNAGDWCKNLSTWWTAVFTGSNWTITNTVSGVNGEWRKSKEVWNPSKPENTSNT